MSDDPVHDLNPTEQAVKALKHLLTRVRNDPSVGWYLGFATETFSLATEALATLTGKSAEDMMAEYSPRCPVDPRADVETVANSGPCLNATDQKLLREVASHLDKDSARHVMNAATVGAQTGYDRLAEAGQLEAWSDALEMLALAKGGEK